MSVVLMDFCSGPRADWEQTHHLARALRRAGRDVWLVCPEGGELAALASGTDVPVLEVAPSRFAGLTSRALERRFQDIGQDIAQDIAQDVGQGTGVDILHVFDPPSLVVGAKLRLRLPNTRLVYGARSAFAPAGRRARRAVSLVEGWTFAHSGLAAATVLAVPSRVIPSFFSGGASRVFREDDRFVFATEGALTQDAARDVLLRAMAQVQGMGLRLMPWEVRVGGAGPCFQDLLRQAEELGVQNRLALLGDQPEGSVLAFADAAIFSSLRGEGDARPLLTAWDMALPVICSSAPALGDLAAHELSALVTPPGDATALAGSMLRFLQEPSLAERLAGGGIAALQRLAPARLAGEYTAFYDEIMAARASL